MIPDRQAGLVPLRPEPRSLEGGYGPKVDAARLLEVLARIDCHVYTGETLPNGEYREIFSGPGIEALLGGPLPPDADPVAAWYGAVHPDDRATHGSLGPADGTPASLEYRLIGYDGVTRWVLDRMWPWPRQSDGRYIYDGIVTDVTDMHEITEELQRALSDARAANEELAKSRVAAELQARTDDLTGLHNRRHFTDMLPRHLTRAGHAHHAVGVLLIDIDFFKRVNDEYGHAAGDELLHAFADRIRSVVRPTDLLARWGGEEFVMLLPETGELTTLLDRAEQIRDRVAGEPFAIAGRSVQVEVSIGAVLATAATSVPDVLLAVDGALYAAKRAGRNRVSLASSSANCG